MKLTRLFFYALVLILPIGTSKIFFSDQSFFYGYHIFYHSFWLYLTDIIFCGLMLCWLWEIVKFGRAKNIFRTIFSAIKQDFLYQCLLFFWLILAISATISREMSISLYGLLRFTQFFLVFVYARENINVSREIRVFFWLILAISFLETGFGMAQYFTQGSLGLKYLGESYLVPGMQGVAEFVSQGITRFQTVSPASPAGGREMLVIRSYGTLPHPNILAVLLFTAWLSDMWLIYATSRKGVSREMVLIIGLILLSTGLVLTFSRAVWFVAGLSLLTLFIMLRIVKRRLFETMKNGQRVTEEVSYHPKKVAIIILALLMSLVLNWAFFGQQIKDRLQGRGVAVFAQQESIVDRQHFASVSREMIKSNPVLGVGLRNFVVRMDEYNHGERLLPQQHQPVHNIYLLMAAETGFIGLAAFLLMLINIVRRGIRNAKAGRGEGTVLLVLFFGFLFLGLFDHYFISIQQSAMLFWIVAGLVSAKQEIVSLE